MNSVAGWTLIRGKRDLKRFEKENLIFSDGVMPLKFPCLAKSGTDSSENPMTEILEMEELEAMLSLLNLVMSGSGSKRNGATQIGATT